MVRDNLFAPEKISWQEKALPYSISNFCFAPFQLTYPEQIAISRN